MNHFRVFSRPPKSQISENIHAFSLALLGILIKFNENHTADTENVYLIVGLIWR